MPTPPAAPSPDELDECRCGHLAQDHEDDGRGACERFATSGFRCSCPSFEALS